MLDVAARRREPEVKLVHTAVDPEEQHAQSPCACSVTLQLRHELPQQMPCRLQHVILARDRLQEHGLGAIDGRRYGGNKRFARSAKGLVEAQEHFTVEACRERGTRLAHHFADPTDAEATQQRERSVRKTQGCKRQIAQCLCLTARINNAALGRAMAGHGPRCASCIRDRHPHRQLKPAEPLRNIRKQAFLAAEQVRTAGDVEKQSVGAAGLVPGGRPRRIAQGPQRKLPECCGVGGRVSIACLQVEDLGARIREQVADREALLARRLVAGKDARTALAGRDKNKRTIGVGRISRSGEALRAQQARDRPRFQPNRNDA